MLPQLALLSELLSCTYELNPPLEEWRKDGEIHSRSHAIITFGYAAPPLKRILLIKRDKQICAIRFTNFSREHNATPGNIFRSGSETFHAEYDWFFQGDGTEDFSQKNVTSGSGELRQGSTLGMGRFLLPSTSAQIHCDGLKVGWDYPMYVPMFLDNDQSNTINTSPTGWSNIDEVNANDARLRWYTFKKDRKTLYIPLADLPKREMGSVR